MLHAWWEEKDLLPVMSIEGNAPDSTLLSRNTRGFITGTHKHKQAKSQVSGTFHVFTQIVGELSTSTAEVSSGDREKTDH